MDGVGTEVGEEVREEAFHDARRLLDLARVARATPRILSVDGHVTGHVDAQNLVDADVSSPSAPTIDLSHGVEEALEDAKIVSKGKRRRCGGMGSGRGSG